MGKTRAGRRYRQLEMRDTFRRTGMCTLDRTGGFHLLSQTEGMGMMVMGIDRNGLHQHAEP